MPNFPLPLIMPIGLSLIGSAILDLTGLGDRPVVRSIDPDGRDIRAEVTIDEDGDDELEITQHPVENGAAISDHAYKRPPEVRLRIGWSTSFTSNPTLLGSFLGTWSLPVVSMAQRYYDIVALQEARRPFTVITGKRTYLNMLVSSIRVHTDASLEHSFIADVTFRKIILVSTQTVQSTVPTNEGQHGTPEKTMPTSDLGPRQTTPTDFSSEQAAQAGANVEQLPSAGTDPVTGNPIGDTGPPGESGSGPIGPIDTSVIASVYRSPNGISSYRLDRR